MEFFLNLAWAATSVLLIAGWIWSIRRGHTQFQWTTLVALALLLVLLFPVISMTDDLVAMNTPAEGEHMVRLLEAPLGQVAVLGLLDAFAALALVLMNMAAPLSFSRIRTRVFAEMLLAGFIRAFGVRPPPAAALFAR